MWRYIPFMNKFNLYVAFGTKILNALPIKFKKNKYYFVIATWCNIKSMVFFFCSSLSKIKNKHMHAYCPHHEQKEMSYAPNTTEIDRLSKVTRNAKFRFEVILKRLTTVVVAFLECFF